MMKKSKYRQYFFYCLHTRSMCILAQLPVEYSNYRGACLRSGDYQRKYSIRFYYRENEILNTSWILPIQQNFWPYEEAGRKILTIYVLLKQATCQIKTLQLQVSIQSNDFMKNEKLNFNVFSMIRNDFGHAFI